MGLSPYIVWLVVSNTAFIFLDIWDAILPFDKVIFFKMVFQPPTRCFLGIYLPGLLGIGSPLCLIQTSFFSLSLIHCWGLYYQPGEQWPILWGNSSQTAASTKEATPRPSHACCGTSCCLAFARCGWKAFNPLDEKSGWNMEIKGFNDHFLGF